MSRSICIDPVPPGLEGTTVQVHEVGASHLDPPPMTSGVPCNPGNDLAGVGYYLESNS